MILSGNNEGYHWAFRYHEDGSFELVLAPDSDSPIEGEKPWTSSVI